MDICIAEGVFEIGRDRLHATAGGHGLAGVGENVEDVWVLTSIYRTLPIYKLRINAKYQIQKIHTLLNCTSKAIQCNGVGMGKAAVPQEDANGQFEQGINSARIRESGIGQEIWSHACLEPVVVAVSTTLSFCSKMVCGFCI